MDSNAPDTGATDIVDRIIGFIRSIGIPVEEGPVPDRIFLEGIRIRAGGIIVDRSTLRWPGDLLHEAGHIAVTPGFARPQLEDALEDEHLHAHASEVEATAWAYAAVCAMRIDSRILFHDGGYQGRGPNLALTYGLGVYPGSMGLSQAGMTRIGAAAAAEGAHYPVMIRWLRE